MTRKHTPNSGSYNDPNSKHNSLPPLAKERNKQAARAQMQRIRDRAPKVPSRPWTPEELRMLFTSNHTLLTLAVYLNRNYGDVSRTSQALTKTYNEEPEKLKELLMLSEVQIELRKKVDADKFKACDKCFMSPHDINCPTLED